MNGKCVNNTTAQFRKTDAAGDKPRRSRYREISFGGVARHSAHRRDEEDVNFRLNP